MSRITPGTMIVAVFAVCFGLVGAYGVRQFLKPPAVPPPAAPETIQVPLASIDLEAGRTISLGDIMLVNMTPEEIQARQLPDQFMSNPQQIIGRILRSPTSKGDAFVTTQLYAEGTGPTIYEQLQQGERAVTINIEGPGAVSGLASAGAVADVLFRSTEDAQKAIPEKVVTLLDKVRVLALGQNTSPGTRNSEQTSTVTMAVTPAQANALKIAEGRGTFSLALRAPQDDIAAPAYGPTTLTGLLNVREKVGFTTEIYRAGSKQTMTFEDGLLVHQEPHVLVTPVAVQNTPSATPAKAVSSLVNNAAAAATP